MDSLTLQTHVSGTLGEYIIAGGSSIIATTLIILIAYMIARRSLLFRIFYFLVPSMAIIAFWGAVIGLNHFSPLPFAVGVIGAVATAVTSLIMLSKFAANTLTQQIGGISSAISQLSDSVRQSATSAREQSATVSQVSNTIDEIHQMEKVTAESAEAVMNVSMEAVTRSREGQKKVQAAIRIMNVISSAEDIVDVVNKLAEQSNLLAVNARIEAAKAGEAGHGFAVVATEVRNLAEQSKRATVQIRNAIVRTEDARHAIQDVEGVIEKLSSVIDISAEKSRHISGAILQQTAGIRQISDAMKIVSANGSFAAQGAVQVEQAVANLQDVSTSLNGFVTGSTNKGR